MTNQAVQQRRRQHELIASVGFRWALRIACIVGGGTAILVTSSAVLYGLGEPLRFQSLVVIGLVSMACCACICEVSARNGLYQAKLKAHDLMAKRLEEKSEEIHRNRELSRRRVRALASAISGRLNNILMVMLGSIEMAARQVRDDAINEELENIRFGIDDASRVCRRLARISAEGGLSNRSTSDLADHVRRILPSIRARAGSAIRLRTEVDDELPVKVAPEALDQLIISATNAHIHTCQVGGNLSIRAWERSTHGSTYVSAPMITLEVESSGRTELQMTPELVKSIRAIQGVRLENIQRGKYRILRICIPSGKEVKPEEHVNFETGSWRNPSTNDILVVEDDRAVQSLLNRMLSDKDCAVFSASDTNHASELLNENSTTIGLAIIDVVLPGASGLKFAEVVRAKYPQIPVIVMTGSTTNGLTDQLATDSAVVLLRKPFMQITLDDAIERLVPLNDLSVVAP